MKNVTNSFIGGFFRKLGNFFAFLFIMFIIGYILSNNNIDISKFLKPIFMTVKADEFTGRYVDIWRYNNNLIPYDGSSDTFNIRFYEDYAGPKTKFFTTSINVPNNSYYVYFKLYHNFRISSSENVDLENTSNIIEGYIIDKSNQLFTLTLSVNGAWSNCENVQSTSQNVKKNNSFYNVGYDTFKCPISSFTESLQELSVTFYADEVFEYYTIGFNANFLFLTSSGKEIITQQQATTQAINNLNNTQQQTNNKIDDLKDTITDNTLSDDDIKDELDSLNNENQSFGFFSTFINLPLTWVQNILASGQSCHAIVVPLPYTNANLTLPCMTDFWNSLGLLGNLIQAVWLAIVGVRIFNGLFLLTVDTISSKDNVDQLTKIKSWEL